MMTTREIYRTAYRYARQCSKANRRKGEFVKFPGGKCYIAGEGYVIVYGLNQYVFPPGTYTCVGNAWKSKNSRRYWIERARETGPVPLP